MKWFGKEALKFFREQRGISLIEAVLAVAILGFIGTGILTAFGTSSSSTLILDEKVVAVNLATDHIEAIKELPYAASYPSASDNITIPPQYNVAIDTECSTDGTIFESCTGSDNQTFQKIVVSISHGDKSVLYICSYRCKR